MAHERVITTAHGSSLARTSMALSTFTRMARQALDAGGRPGGVRGGGAADAALAYLDALAADCAADGEVRLRWHEAADWLNQRLTRLNAAGEDQVKLPAGGGQNELKLRWRFEPA